MASLVFKSGSEKIQIDESLTGKPLWDYTVKNIDNELVTLRDLVRGKRAVMFVNVASK